jgi:hypothetical protein
MLGVDATLACGVVEAASGPACHSRLNCLRPQHVAGAAAILLGRYSTLSCPSWTLGKQKASKGKRPSFLKKRSKKLLQLASDVSFKKSTSTLP